MLGSFFNSKGKKKTSKAIVFIKSGTGKITINGLGIYIYFKKTRPIEIINEALKELDYKNLDIKINVKGGGVISQADSIKLAIGKCITILDPLKKFYIKKLGLLSYDKRIVERKKPGKVKARKKKQYSKR
ncbi:30S ribosomal protein S9 [Candidatus Vidania fulgoroideorum]